jgi:hypothetical protein
MILELSLHRHKWLAEIQFLRPRQGIFREIPMWPCPQRETLCNPPTLGSAFEVRESISMSPERESPKQPKANAQVPQFPSTI